MSFKSSDFPIIKKQARSKVESGPDWMHGLRSVMYGVFLVIFYDVGIRGCPGLDIH